MGAAPLAGFVEIEDQGAVPRAELVQGELDAGGAGIIERGEGAGPGGSGGGDAPAAAEFDAEAIAGGFSVGVGVDQLGRGGHGGEQSTGGGVVAKRK